MTYTPEQLSAFWSAVGALATVAAAVVAILTLRALRRDSLDRTRPVMGAYLQHHPLAQGTSELVVTNYGATAARDVRVTFDPPLPKLEGPEAAGKITPFLEKRYDRVIPTVAPGMKLINVYTVMGDQNDEPVPMNFTIMFSYTDPRGKERYQDSYPLTVETLRNSTATNPSDTPDDSGLPRRTTKALEAIARGIGRR